jgi:cytochrome c oxidase cbb3-type subunit 4
MYKELLRSITGIETFPVISLVLFVVVFGFVVYRACRLDRRRLDRLARLPLDGDSVRPEVKL